MLYAQTVRKFMYGYLYIIVQDDRQEVTSAMTHRGRSQSYLDHLLEQSACLDPLREAFAYLVTVQNFYPD